MDDTRVEAFADAAADGVDFDGIEAQVEDDSFRLSTADGTTAEGAVTALADVDPAVEQYVTNWYFWHATAPQAEPRWAFLRWLEGADDLPVPERYARLEDGVTTTWGELAITVELGDDGERVYDLRHEDDRGVDTGDLEQFDDPVAARDLAKHDDRDRYRPLKTAPTLRSDWVFPELDASTLVEAVHTFYPATVQNWHRERAGDLDVTHWHETTQRQTGIYGVVKTWDRGEGYDHVNWVAEACCDDSQCLKRREWEYDDETELDVDGGDGKFPCREPCSVVITAARQWTKMESEQPQTYEFELTPSEKEQIEAIIDAVAEGRADDIREADIYDGANRYRARFLRAKLFDEEENLAGVPTDD